MYYTIKRWLKWELPYYPKYFIEGVKNLIRWFPIIWKDRNWDHHYIWEIMKFKLSNQSKYIGTKDRHISAKRDAEIMMTCVRLIDKIQSEYYSSEYMDYHKSEFHWDDYEDKPDHKQLRIEELNENFDDYFSKYFLIYKKVRKSRKTLFPKKTKQGIAMNIAYINHQRAKKLLFNILENNIERWWD